MAERASDELTTTTTGTSLALTHGEIAPRVVEPYDDKKHLG
jgi:hypothetical protein